MMFIIFYNMKYFLIISFLFTANIALSDTTFLQKSSADDMFKLTKREWIDNLKQLKLNKVADFKEYIGENFKEYTMMMRTNPGTGLLMVTPIYFESKLRPIQIHVSISADEKSINIFYNNMKINDVKSMIEDAVDEMQPEYTVFGYMVRNKKIIPSLHFIILEKDKFPEMDYLQENGLKCVKAKCIHSNYLDGPH